MDTRDWEGTYIDVGDVASELNCQIPNIPHLIRWGLVGFVIEYHPQGLGVGNHDSDKSPPCPTYARMGGSGA